MLNVLIVRHGQSEWNALGRWQGHADPPLSDVGMEQARAAAPRIGAFDAIVSSDLDRAATTARIIAEAVGVGPVTTDEGLRERDIGEWQGLTRAEIEDGFPGQLRNGHRPPSWESDEAMLERLLDSVRRLAERVASGDVLVVAHTGVIYMFERHLGADFAPIGHLHGRWLHLDRGQLELGGRVALLSNDVDSIADP